MHACERVFFRENEEKPEDGDEDLKLEGGLEQVQQQQQQQEDEG